MSSFLYGETLSLTGYSVNNELELQNDSIDIYFV